MSSIDPSNINLVSSIVGGQRAVADVDRQKAESANHDRQVSQTRFSVVSAEDLAEANLSAERDPDGRSLLGNDEEPAAPVPGNMPDLAEQQLASLKPIDPDNVLGTILDVQA